MNVIICDDDRMIHDEYSKTIENLAAKYHVKLNLIHFDSGKAMLEEYKQTKLKADVIFLDIHMPGMDGDRVAQELRAAGYKNDIVFVTVSKQVGHFKKALKYKTLDYVIKGETSQEEFEQIFIEAVRMHKNRIKRYIVLSAAGVTVNIEINEIQYFERSDRKTACCYSVSKLFMFYESITSLFNQLEFHGFIKANNATLVNLAYVDSISRTELIMNNGKTVFINKDNYSMLKKVWEDYKETQTT